MHAVREWLCDASSVAVLTGAGVSAESGVPTFRGSNGLWKQYRADELATPGAFARGLKNAFIARLDDRKDMILPYPLQNSKGPMGFPVRPSDRR
jgi:NAD-dependent SIR2 family protein deacetylase